MRSQPERSIQSYKNIKSQSSNQALLIKSKHCLDRLNSRISEEKNNLKNWEILKPIEEAAKNIQKGIESKIDRNFNSMLNEHSRVNPNEQSPLSNKEKQEAVKKLMQDYWKRKQQSDSQAKRRTICANKQNILPKIKTQAQQKEIDLNSKHKKKAIISSVNVKIYEKHKERESLKKTKEEKILAYLYSYMVHVVDYKVQNDTPEFLLFQKINYAKWESIEQILGCIQQFTNKYQLKYCTLDLQKVMNVLESKNKVNMILSQKNKHKSSTSKSLSLVQGEARKNDYTPHQLLSCFENSQEISAQNCRKPGIRFYGNKGKLRAITKIQSVWRGKISFRKVLKLKQTVKKVIKIQRAYKTFVCYLKTKQRVRERCLEKLKWFEVNQQKFRQQYRMKEHTTKIKYQIHICTDSQNQWQRCSTEKWLQRQNSYLTRVFKAVSQQKFRQTKIIFVTAIPIQLQTLNYYKKLAEFVGDQDFKKRVVFMSPENSQNLKQRFPLTRLIYYSPSVLNKIRALIGQSYAVIIPSTPSLDYISISHYLKIPIFSSEPQTLLYLQTNSGCKSLLEQSTNLSQVHSQRLPYASNIYSLPVLVHELTSLIQSNPKVRRWILKIDNQFNSRGIAYIDTQSIIPKKMAKFLRKAHCKNNTEGKQILQSRYLTKQIFNSIYNFFTENEKMVIVDQIYRSQKEYLNFYFSNGGIIQADITSSDKQPQSLCFCIKIDPDSEWRFLTSYRKISVKKKSLCCYFQSQLIQPPIQIQDIIKALLKRKCFGYFVLQFLKDSFQKSDEKIYFNGIKCYMDIYSSGSFLREFISKQSNALYIPYISHPNISRINLQTFFHLCRLQNISFDIQRRLGNIFLFLDGLQSGCLGMMTFNNSSKVETFIHAAEVLDFFSSKINQSSSSTIPSDFMTLRNSINGHLNHERKKKNAIKSDQQIRNRHSKQMRSYKENLYLTDQ